MKIEIRLTSLFLIFSYCSIILRTDALANLSSNKMPKKSATFVTNKMCPFAQKCWSALEASHLPYELKEVGLYGAGGKPNWFLKLNPKGTVPVLEISGKSPTVYPDSELILDYINSNTDLKSPEKDEEIQKWRNIVSNQIIPIGKRAVLGGGREQLDELLQEIDGEVEGPFLCGDAITVADCAAFPFVWRINDEFGLDDDSKLKKWLSVCVETDCFKKTIRRSWWWWW